MSTWMIFRTIVGRHELTDCLDAAQVLRQKVQHNLAPHFERFRGNQRRAIPLKVLAAQGSDVEQRAAAADQTCVVWAVADNIALNI
jgi:hypothetical protein